MGLYKINKSASCKDTIECPVCHKKFIKKQYSQVFCSSTCKDKYWNGKGDRHSPEYYEKQEIESVMKEYGCSYSQAESIILHDNVLSDIEQDQWNDCGFGNQD